MAFTYDQYETSPTGMTYLTGDIMPWHDYVIMRTDAYTSVAIYGQCDEDLHFDEATVRTVFREDNYGASYVATEETLENVIVNVSNPYYAYGNVIGVSYNLPSSSNIQCLAVCAAVCVCALISLFRLVWSLKRGTVR